MSVIDSRTALALLVAATLVVGCGGKSDDTSAEDSAAVAQADSAAPAAEPAPAAAAAAPAADNDAPLTVADIDRWQRGMVAEAKAVEDAGTKLRAATSSADTLAAMMGANETSTRATGASAAGIPEQRYNIIRSQLSEIVSQMSPLEQEMDVSKMPAPMVEEMRKGREAGLARVTANLPPEVLEALRPRAAELRKQELALVAARMKAAGLGR
jgi:hypothetical protein